MAACFFFLLLYNHFKPFLEFRPPPPIYFDQNETQPRNNDDFLFWATNYGLLLGPTMY